MARDRFVRRGSLVRRALLAALVLGGGALTACSSGPGQPPFPQNPDPCSSYCLKWVPPTYREVPRVCMTKPPGSRSYEVCTANTCFREVVTPGECKTVTVPDECRKYSIVQTTPARNEWRRVECTDCAGCDLDDCWRNVRVPPTYDICERCETKEGFSYCVETPPTIEIVPETKLVREVRTEYVPAEYGVKYEKHCFTPGHWEWEARICPEPEPKCPPKCLCAPCPSEQGARCDACKGGVRLNRPTWGRCPSAD